MQEKPQVVYLRGSSLNSWEMQNFGMLEEQYDLLAVGDEQSSYDVSRISFPVVHLKTLGDVREKFGPLKNMPGMDRLGDRYLDLTSILHYADIVHSAETFNVYSQQAAQLKERFNYKLVLTIWENIPFLWDGVGGNSRRVQHRKQEVIKNTDLFMAVTNRAKQALILEGVPEERISVVMMGIDTKRFSPMGKDPVLMDRYGIASNDVVVLTVANLHWHKGVQELIFAAGLLKNAGLVEKHHLKFMIIGKGEDQKEIYNLIERVGVVDHFILETHADYEDMPKVHNLGDIFYLGSWPSKLWQEQFGMVLIESMACGKAVIAAESGSISEVVEDAAILFSPADFVALSEKLTMLIRDKSLRIELGKKGFSRAQELFSSHNVAKKIDRLYRELLKKQ